MAITVDRDSFVAAVFDLDGVITDTASVHATAWAQLFDEYLTARSGRTGERFEPFTPTDYLQHVDGKPRYDGVRDFLASRGVELPEGDLDDPEQAETVHGLGNRKDGYFNERLRRDGVDVFATSVDLVQRMRRAGMRTALFSASRNARPILQVAGLTDLFDAVVDGVDADRAGLPGKPDPAVPLEAARLVGASPDRTVIVEDALAGVEAGRRGGFRLVVGVDRGEAADELLQRGADVVIADLGEIEVAGGTPDGASDEVAR